MRGEWGAYWLAEVAATENAYVGVGDEILRLAAEGILDVAAEKSASLCSLVRDLFGPLPLARTPLSWKDGTVVPLAQAVYEDRAFDRLPILADALEDVGCTDHDLLGHCRGPGPHMKGCWAVDAILVLESRPPPDGPAILLVEAPSAHSTSNWSPTEGEAEQAARPGGRDRSRTQGKGRIGYLFGTAAIP
jgi:hypothetical protein